MTANYAENNPQWTCHTQLALGKSSPRSLPWAFWYLSRCLAVWNYLAVDRRPAPWVWVNKSVKVLQHSCLVTPRFKVCNRNLVTSITWRKYREGRRSKPKTVVREQVWKQGYRKRAEGKPPFGTCTSLVTVRDSPYSTATLCSKWQAHIREDSRESQKQAP